MSDNFIITTTNNIEGCSIERYLDPICVNVVIGTNIFSDIAASFSDFFGGRSGSYQSKLEMIYNTSTKELKDKATKLGANAIIGFKVDFDEISGGGKSMFMVSASGTACIIDYQKKDNQNYSYDTVSQEILDIELKRRYIIEQINNRRSSIEQEWIDFLYEHPSKDIINELLDRYITHLLNIYGPSIRPEFVEKYLTILPKNDFIDNVYSRYIQHPRAIKELIKCSHLFSSSHILNIAKEDIHLAINLLDTSQDYYQKKDVDIMKQILSYIDSIPEVGKIELKHSRLVENKEIFICQCGYENDKEREYCSKCAKNIKGLTQQEVQIVEDFRNKVDVLASLLNIY